MNTSSAEITESRASVPYAKRAVANTVLTASARSAADAQANTTAAVSALGVKRRAGITTVTVPAPYVRCVASALESTPVSECNGDFAPPTETRSVCRTNSDTLYADTSPPWGP